MNFSTKELVLITLTGTLAFVVDSVTTVISKATGVSGAGHVVSGVLFAMVCVIGGLIVKKFGTFTLMSLVYAVLSSFTAQTPMPIIYQTGVFVLSGFLIDIVVAISKYKPLGYYIGTVIGNWSVLFLQLWIMLKLGIPGGEELLNLFWVLLILFAIGAIIGTWLGIKIHRKKISKMNIIKQFGVKK